MRPRKATAEIAAKRFLEALSLEFYPDDNLEGLFGVRRNKGRVVSVKIPTDAQDGSMQTTEVKLGDLVFEGWITLWRASVVSKEEIVQALLENRLRNWYEEKIRNNGNPLSYYTLAMVESDVFREINWAIEAHYLIAGMQWVVPCDDSSAQAA